jgi:3-phenylpropionate/trans-cinnamate dioxygenase ferredoxin reductase subunit
MPNRQSRPIIVVGAGLAGAKTVEELRAAGYDGKLLLLGSERHRPYERPPLSKDYLTGSTTRDKVYVHPEDWYAQHDVDLRVDTTVTDICPMWQEITTTGWARIPYDKLLLATGASARRLPLADSERILYLRTLDDADRIIPWLRTGARIAIIGGGWIGLETAAAARAAGAEVTVLETAALPLLRVLGPKVARIFADTHRHQGVDLRCDVTIDAVQPGRDGVRVVIRGGGRVDADVAVVGIGANPNTALAERAGLDITDGVQTDAQLRTSHPHIWAAGDVANAYHPVLGHALRVEHWANALHQPAVAAQTMLGVSTRYDRLPYFYTDQYDLSVEYVGYVPAGGQDHVLLRGSDRREFVALWVDGARVLAGMVVNASAELPAIEELIRSGRPVDASTLWDFGRPLTAV